jgi:hypothetical protein
LEGAKSSEEIALIGVHRAAHTHAQLTQAERRLVYKSIGLSAHGSARLPVNEFGSILAAKLAKYAGFAADNHCIVNNLVSDSYHSKEEATIR